MALTRDFKQTVVERVRRDPAFAQALFNEALTMFLQGEPDAARVILRDLVNATVGFEGLARMTEKPPKSLHRMLSPRGNPSMDNLSDIVLAAQRGLQLVAEVKTVPAARGAQPAVRRVPAGSAPRKQTKVDADTRFALRASRGKGKTKRGLALLDKVAGRKA